MDKFKIKYYILEEDLEGMKHMTLPELAYEFSSIYGQFTFTINQYEYLVYFEPNILSADIMPTELVNVHFYSLIDVIQCLNNNKVAYMPYIENNWTWVKFKVSGTNIYVSELKRKCSSKDTRTCNVSKEYFDYDYTELINGPFIIDAKQFIEEVNTNIITFVETLKDANPLNLKNNSLKKIINYYTKIIDEKP